MNREPSVIERMQALAVGLLNDVQHIRAAGGRGEAPSPDLLRQMRVNADGIKTATLALQTEGGAPKSFHGSIAP